MYLRKVSTTVAIAVLVIAQLTTGVAGCDSPSGGCTGCGVAQSMSCMSGDTWGALGKGIMDIQSFTDCFPSFRGQQCFRFINFPDIFRARKLTETVTFEYPAGKGRTLADEKCFSEGDSILDIPIVKAAEVSTACAENAKGACTGAACTWNAEAEACAGSVEPYGDIIGISAKFMTWMVGNEACESKDTCEGTECKVDDDKCVASDSIVQAAVADVADQMIECDALTEDLCNTEACAWSGSECALSAMHGLGLIFTEGKPLYKVIETALGCSAKVAEGDCSGSCAWDSAKGAFYGGSFFTGSCDISETAAVEAFMPPMCEKMDSGNRLWPAAASIIVAVLLATTAGM